MLRWIGHPDVAVLDGGWSEWQRLGLPVESDARARAGLTLRTSLARLVTVDDVRSNTSIRNTASSRRELRARFVDATHGKPAVHQCESGVMACHNMLAMAHAGLPEGALLYAGSWSEWIEDPARPIASGH